MTQTETTTGPLSNPTGSPIDLILRFFSSIRLGILLLSLLFIYCSIGSVGVWVPGTFPAAYHQDWVHHIYWLIPWTQYHIRQAPGLEMTEFEWFHWWPFNLLILLICINLIVATLRRIPLNIVNLGVWMIHTGIIVLCIGSVMYFATKLEGDAPIIRRQLVIQFPGEAPFTMAAQPGNDLQVAGPGGTWRFQVMNIDPNWEMLTGDAKGVRTYAVMVAVQSPTENFVRTIPARFPDETQDAIFTGDATQPMQRAIHALGKPLVDESLSMSLVYLPQEHFYLVDSAALYLREKGQREWSQRPIRNLPRYNDYVDSHRSIWPRADMREVQLNPLSISVPPMADNQAFDPLGSQPVSITSYLRYAMLEDRPIPGGPTLNPYATVEIRSRDGRRIAHDLFALDSMMSMAQGGRLHFRWVNSEEALEAMIVPRAARLSINVPEHQLSIDTTLPAVLDPDAPFTEIDGTNYAYRVESLHDGLTLASGGMVSVAIVRIRSPERTFRRWVMSDDRLPSRDLPITGSAATGMHDEELPFDEAIAMVYHPGRALAPVTIVAGPRDGDLRLVLALGAEEPSVKPLRMNEATVIDGDITLTVLNYGARATVERRASIVPPSQRHRNDRQQNSMIRVDIPGAAEPVWLHYHVYPFPEINKALRRFRFQPREVMLTDGRIIELIYARQRLPLPAPVALDDFIVTSHIGGFTGQTPSIRDWTSMVRFITAQGWTDPKPISMNKPTSFGGFWYFQAQWDPPDPPRFQGDAPSNGLNFTVLGVGNRNGVYTQLLGCVIAVAGMIYAFYVKPVIKRRRQQAVYDNLNRATGEVSHEEGGLR